MNTRTHPSPSLVCRSRRNTLRCQGFAASLPCILAASPPLSRTVCLADGSLSGRPRSSQEPSASQPPYRPNHLTKEKTKAVP
ncbi:hypothetical protein AHAS_Ahas11G0079100 [Arachis hypogaea]